MTDSLGIILLIVLGIVIIETIGQYFLKKYQKEAKFYFLMIGCVCFVLMAILISRGLHFDKLIVVNMLWAAVSTLVLTAMGWFLFNETLSWVQGLGVAVILLGMFLLTS